LNAVKNKHLAMESVEHLGWFVLAGWLLNLTPGPDVLYIINSSLRGGLRAGAAAAMGITAGCFVHVFAAALGVGTLMASSAAAFGVLKWCGAAYLTYVGVRLLMSKSRPLGPDPGDRPAAFQSSLTVVFIRGFLTNVLNPKVALFFLAFVPQFIVPEAAHPTWAFLLLGVLFNLNALPINLGYAAIAAWAVRRMGVVQRGMAWLERIAGIMFIGFGLKLAWTDQPVP
jgi:threonine/homoserine/homoserine lactone efflux protein